MSNGYSSGRVCDLFREHYTDNSSSYAASNVSDDFRFNSTIDGTPDRTGHTHDTTAYSSQPTADSWVIQLRQAQKQV